MKSPFKLVNKIRDSLVGHPDFALLQSLASEYAELITIANARLEQCSLILNSGDEYQTLQMAEVHPPLLDLVAALSFQESADWKRLCQEKGFEVPERLNEKSIAALNELYHKGLSPTHPYYKEYRAAMFEKNEDKALSVLFTIARLNSKDEVAQSDLENLQKRVLEKKLAQLHSAMQTGDKSAIAQLADDIERFDPKHEFWNDDVEQAQQIYTEYLRENAIKECSTIYTTLEELFRAGKIAEAKPLLEKFINLRHDFQITFGDEIEASLISPDSWFSNLRSTIEKQDKENNALSEIKNWLNENEGALVALPSLSNREIKKLVAESNRIFSSAENPTANIVSRISTFKKSLQTESDKRKKEVHSKLILWGALIGIFVLIGGWTSWKWSRSQVYLAALEKLKSEQKVHESQKILDSVGKPSFFNNPFIKEKHIREYEVWVRESTANGTQALYLLKQFETSAAKQFAGTPLAENQDIYKQLDSFSKTLPPEYANPISDSISKLDDAWKNYLKSENKKVETSFADTLSRAESDITSQINYTMPPDKIRAALSGLQRYEQELSNTYNDPSAKEFISQSQGERYEAFRLKIASFKLEVDNYDEAISKLKNSLDSKNFFAAFRLLSDSQLVSTAEVRAARELKQGNSDIISDIPQFLLLPGNPDGWKSISTSKNTRPIPSDAKPEEISMFVNLRDNQELRNIWKYELRSYFKKKSFSQPDETRLIYTLGALPIPREKTDLSKGDMNDVQKEWSGQIYDPKTHPDTAVFMKRVITGSRNQKLDTVFGDILDNGSITPESEMILHLGLDDFYSGENKSFKLSILTILDRLRANKAAHPLIKAYVHLTLASIAEGRPVDWGLHLSPAAVQHYKQLQEILRPAPAAGEWMVPRKRSQTEAKLIDFYNKTALPSYEIQFKLHQLLFQEALQDGFAFVGYIDVSGRPILLPDGMAAREIWGLDKAKGNLILLMKSDDGKGAPKLVKDAAPFSPLYAGKSDRLQIKRKVYESLGIATGDKNYEAYLPVYFRDNL